MPPHSSGVTLNTTGGTVTFEDPQLNIGYSVSPICDYTYRPEDFNCTLQINNTAIGTTASVYTDSGFTRLIQTMQEMSISANEVSELLRRFSRIDSVSLRAADPEEIEQSEELDEFLNGFSVDSQEVI